MSFKAIVYSYFLIILTAFAFGVSLFISSKASARNIYQETNQIMGFGHKDYYHENLKIRL